MKPTKKNTNTSARRETRVQRWTQDRVLAVARQRTRELTHDLNKIQGMLAQLMVESGWSNEDFSNALCLDVIQRANDPVQAAAMDQAHEDAIEAKRTQSGMRPSALNVQGQVDEVKKAFRR